ncbi:hypothetical protein C453_19440 [Haloferax elongans ATCC BAA-1513]|uniref:Protein-glutamine gamma-glutamyltransferase-like C-terminal domain-containing protein n=1 Tax=Haloferax elongans ATCC BAA-1513 TaxID=1230453 RepID=M0H716_HALEO|nr:DUF4129 domain-containing protein [Haloferax elongans]ELZ80280.1 hypothetical protein C453_19440 [Haloferax elongans ATCC BAA-1513]
MNRSRAIALLVTVFALAVLGVAAGTLESAQPTAPTDSGDAPTSPRPGSDEGSPKPDEPDGQPVEHVAFPDVDLTNGLDSGGNSESTLSRLGIGVVLFVIGSALVLWRLTSDDSQTEIDATRTETLSETAETTHSPETHVRDVSPTNGVYHSWYTMVSLLDSAPDPQRTPTELEQDALESGFPESAVHSITDLFCAVRYGGQPPTSEREQRAQDALESIQRGRTASTDLEAPVSEESVSEAPHLSEP